jgi:hypothetical protein
MNLRKKMMGLGIAALVAGTLGAQDTQRWSVGLGYLLPLDSTKDITNATGLDSKPSLNVDFGFATKLAATDVPVRISLGLNNLPGKENVAGEKRSLMGIYLGADLFFSTGIDKLHLVTGVSINKWRMKYDAGSVSESESVDGLKFGGRIGLDYQVNPRLSLNVSLNAVELGLVRTGMTPSNRDGWNPSWIQVGGRFHF